MSEFKIKGAGLDTTTLDYTPSEEFDFEYIFTSITANNEHVVRDYSKGASLITYINFLDKSDEAISSHLNLLDRKKIDLLLVDANCDFVKYVDTLNTSIDIGNVDSIGVYGPTSVERVKEIQEVLPNLQYIGIEICPLNFNYELVSWAIENGLQIIGFNTFGGHVSSAAIVDSFSVPYLLGFASTYCTLIFLSGRDLFTAADNKGYIEELIGKESSDIYKLEKSISKLYKPIRRSIGVSLKLDLNHTLPLYNQEAIFRPDELEIKLGDPKEEVRDFDVVVGSVEDLVYDYYGDFKTPEDIDSDEAMIALTKSHVMDILKEEYGEDWTVTFNKIGDKLFIINLSKPTFKGKWIFKKMVGFKSVNYIYSINNKSLEFCKLELSGEEPNNKAKMVESADNIEQNS